MLVLWLKKIWSLRKAWLVVVDEVQIQEFFDAAKKIIFFFFVKLPKKFRQITTFSLLRYYCSTRTPKFAVLYPSNFVEHLCYFHHLKRNRVKLLTCQCSTYQWLKSEKEEKKSCNFEYKKMNDKLYLNHCFVVI